MRENDVGRIMQIAVDVAKRLPPVRSLGCGNVFRYLIVAKDPDDPDEIERRFAQKYPTSDEQAVFDFAVDLVYPLPLAIRNLFWLYADGHSWVHIGRMVGYNPRYCSRLWRIHALRICTDLSPPVAVLRRLLCDDAD
jgi:hypothetical protein